MQGNKLQKANAKELRLCNSQTHELRAAFAAMNQQTEIQNDDAASLVDFVA